MKLNPLPFLALCLATLTGPLTSRAATVWTGPTITYNQPGTDPTQPENQDPLTPHVSLTRAVSSGMFNAVSEGSYTHNGSPADTEWAVGSLDDYATLTYTDWETCGGGHPVLNLPGQQLVVHLISEDIYLSLQFTYLGGHFAGGFTYIRSTPATPDEPMPLTFNVSGNKLDLSWPVAGARLLTQTNSLGVGLGTNWVTYPNSTATNHVVVTIDPTVGAMFFRLAEP